MIRLLDTAFNPYDEIQAYQNQQTQYMGKYGATSLFIGSMRDFNDDHPVTAMYLEHYPKMTEYQLAAIVTEASQKWVLLDSLILHRIGHVSPNDYLVLVAVWAVHRGDAFDANRFIMEALKLRAPFWKKEQLDAENSQWVSHNSDGYQKK